MITKRGVSSDLFVWLFALVAGALLLLFFIVWSGRHATTSTTVEDITFLRSFEQQISALSTTDELSKTLTFPKTLEVRVSCGTFFTDKVQEQHALFLFSPPLLTNQQYTLIGKSWRFPFYLDMVYYLIPEGTLALLFYEPRAASFITSLDIPTAMPLKTLPLSSYSLATVKQQIQGYRQVTIAFVGPAPDTTALFAALSSMSIILLAVDVDRSLITFYPGGRQQPYYGEAFFLGALFGPEQYACLSQRSLERLHQLSSLYQQKTVLLQQKLGGSSCSRMLAQGASLLTTLRTAEDSEQVQSTVASLQSINEDLERDGCATLF